MIKDYFEFKSWVAILNASFFFLFIWLAIVLFSPAITKLANLSQFSDIYVPAFWVVVIWLAICEFGYTSLLYLPKGIALELHDDHIRVCSPTGIKKIPRKGVRGCKNSVHRMTRGKNSGLVIISVAPEYRVIGPYGFRINPRFHGASVVGEDEQTIVKKIRAWRKAKNC
jgi:hypothetical protein